MTAVAKIETPQAPAVQSEAAAIFSMIERVMADPSVPIERAEQAFAFYQKVQADQARKAFTSSFIAVQNAIEPVRRTANNPQTHSKYATFEALDAAARPILSKHGFAVSFNTAPGPSLDYVKVIMTLMHESGHERLYEADLPADGKGAKGGDVMTKTHAVGSAMSYGKRYVMGNALNIPTTKDDDGNKAADTGEVINEAQFLEIANLIRETNTDMDRFLAVGRLESLSDMRANQFEKAKALLLAKKRGASK
jgi:hypothetical protein